MKTNSKFMKKINVLLLIVMVTTIILGNTSNAGFVDGDVQITDRDVVFKINGVAVDPDIMDAVEDGDSLEVEVEWALSNSDKIVDGDTLVVNVPDGLLMPTNIGEPLYFNGVEVGTYSVDAAAQTMTIQFNEDAAGEDIDSVSVGFSSMFDLDEVEENNNPVEFLFEFDESLDKTMTIRFVIEGVTSPIEQNGTLDSTLDEEDANDTVNPTAIKWNTKVNKTYELLEELGTVVAFDEGLSLDETSIKVYPLEIGLDKKPIKSLTFVDSSNYTVVNDPANNTFTIVFDNDANNSTLATINSPYQIDYTTNITTPNITEALVEGFDSRASYVFDDGIFSTATVDNQRGDKLVKTAEKDRDYNTKSIEWTVLINQFEGNMVNGLLIDTLPDGLTYIGQATISPIELDETGTIDSGRTLSDIDPVIDGQEMTFTLPPNTQSAYELKYTTEIDLDAFDEDDFTNDAKLYDTILVDSTDLKVSITRGEALEKGHRTTNFNGFEDDKEIEWRLDINAYEMDIVGGLLTDTAGPNLEFDTDSIEIKLMSYSASGVASEDKVIIFDDADDSKDAVSFESGDTVMKIDLAKLANLNSSDFTKAPILDQGIRVYYKTNVTDNHHNDDYGNFNNTVVLTGTINGNGLGDGDGILVTKKLWTNIKNKVNKSVDDSVYTGGVNYSNDEMYWKVVLSAHKEAMHDVVLVDSFPNNGLTFDPDSLVVTGTTSGALVVNVDYTISEPDGGDYSDGFIVALRSFDNENITLKYTTIFSRESHALNGNESEYKNKVDVTWKELSYDPEDQEKTATDNATIDVTDTGRDNGSMNGELDRPNQVVNWIVNANYMAETHDDYQIDVMIKNDDTSGDKDEREFQSIDESSIEVYSYTVAPDGTITESDVLDPANYSLTEIMDDSFTVTLDGNITTPYRVRFQTQLVNESQANYSAYATVGPNDRDLSAGVAYPNSDVFLEKDAPTSDSTPRWVIMDWVIRANTSMSTVVNAQITDELGGGHEYIEDSLKIYKNDESDPIDQSDYTVTFELLDLNTFAQEMVISFVDTIEDEYTVKYSTLVISTESMNISNTASFSGEGISIENQDDSSSKNVTVLDSFASVRGQRGDFTLTKVDGDDDRIPLAGVVYDLLDSEENLIGTLDETDINGQVSLSNLKKAVYYLRETQALEGYLLDSDLIEVNLEDNNSLDITEKNYKKRTIVIDKYKMGAEDVKLEGAVFTITGPLDTVDSTERTLTTDENGAIEISALAFGEYEISEIQAPEGYDRNTATVSLVVNELQEVYEVPFGNEETSVSLTKVDGDDNSIPLAGVVYELLDSEENLIQTLDETDENGQVSLSKLAKEVYYLRETQALDGYLLDSNLIRVNLEDYNIVEITAKNYKERTIVIDKYKNGAEDVKLEGAVFTITGPLESADSIERTLTTDENGAIELTGLSVGEYEISEIEAPVGYDRNATSVTVEVNELQAVYRVPFGNEETKVTLTKVDGDDNSILLAGVVYELLDEEENLIQTLDETDENGQVILSKLAKDLYYLRESETLDGYLLDTDLIEVNLEDNNSVEITAKNYKERTIIIDKYKKNAEDVKLEGAVFTITGPIESVDSIERSLTTNENGAIEIPGLAFGEYEISETKAPRGYDRDRTSVTLVVGELQEVYEVSFENKKSDDDDVVVIVEEEEVVVEEEVEEEVVEEEEVEEETEEEVVEEETDDNVPVFEEITDEEETTDDNTEDNDITEDSEISSPEDEEDTEDDSNKRIIKTSEDVETIEVVVEPENGSVTIDENNNIIYTPNEDSDGTDTMIVVVNKGGEEFIIELEFGDEELAQTVIQEIPELPETSGIPMDLYVYFGSGLTGLGLFLRKKK